VILEAHPRGGGKTVLGEVAPSPDGNMEDKEEGGQGAGSSGKEKKGKEEVQVPVE